MFCSENSNFFSCHSEQSEESLKSSSSTLFTLCDLRFDWEIPRLRGMTRRLALAARHHFEQYAFEIFGFGNRRQHRVIERLFEPAQPSRRAARIHQRVRDCLLERRVAHVMRTRKCCEQTIFRKQFERAQMQIAIPA